MTHEQLFLVFSLIKHFFKMISSDSFQVFQHLIGQFPAFLLTSAIQSLAFFFCVNAGSPVGAVENDRNFFG